MGASTLSANDEQRLLRGGQGKSSNLAARVVLRHSVIGTAVWLAILILAPICIVLLGHYFSGQVAEGVGELFPRADRIARRMRLVYLVLIYTVPILIVVWVLIIVFGLADGTRPPPSWALEYLVVLPFWFAVVYSVQCSLFIVPAHLLTWSLGKAGVSIHPRWQRRRWAFVLLIAASFAIYMPVQIAIDWRSLDVRHHELASAEVPAELDGLKIALIADPQADSYTTEARLAQLVEATNSQKPDLILIGGDVITGAPEYIHASAAALAELEAPRGVLSAIGDHDNFAYRDRERSVREIRQALAARDVPMLDNEVRRIQIGGRELAVVVATDNYITPLEPEAAAALMERASGADFTIVLAHQARETTLAEARDGGAQLFLSGHTHGGQVKLWLPGLDLVAARVETPYITGRYRGGALGDMDLVVSSGLGVSVIPFRYRVPASIDILTLRHVPPPGHR